MEILNTYTIEISIDDKPIEYSTNALNFSMKDSIHGILPEFEIEINDLTGFFQEYLMLTEGLPLKIRFGNIGEEIECKYIISDDSLEKLNQTNFIGGKVFVRAIHEIKSKDAIKNKVFTNSVSNIINQIINQYGIVSSIDSTDNSIYFIQPLINDVEFIKKILIPNSYSASSMESPFFAWIDNSNKFNYKNYNSLITSNPVETLEYVVEKVTKPEQKNIITLKRLRTGLSINHDLKKRLIVEHSRQTGQIVEKEDTIADFPKSSNKRIPVVDQDILTNYVELYEGGKDSNEKAYLKAQQIHGQRDSLFLDRLLITTPLNTKIRAGTIVDVKIPTPIANDNQESTTIYSGKYLVESSDHSWDGEKQFGYTKILCSKKYIQTQGLENKYKLANKLYQT